MQRDPNHIVVIKALNTTTGLAEALRVDPVTDELLITVLYEPAGTPADIIVGERDKNHIPAQLAYNATSLIQEVVRCTDNGTLLVKLV